VERSYETMNITINGKEKEIEKEVTVKELLDTEQVEMQEYVTVQLNDEIIPRDSYDTTLVKEGSVIEFLYYMGGGSEV
ncbi:MAG: thiamine biosynthesis protein ThiS, partial [Oscillospiraceae bacterium]|nr:thiamine biosynthesis protein ThiS [Oscillospiraceae bacterium]